MSTIDAEQIVMDLTTLVSQVTILNNRVKEVMMKARRLQDQAKMDEIRRGQGMAT